MKGKYLFLTGIIAILLAFVFTIPTFASDTESETETSIVASGEIGANATYELTDDGVLTISGTGPTYGYSASGNNFTPFKYLSITSVVIKTGISSIGNELFNDCYNISSVSIPASVQSIGSFAFAACYDLTTIKIPASVTYIGDYAFLASGLTEIELPDSVTYLGDYAFQDCNNLTIVPGVLDENIRYTLNKETGEFHFRGSGSMPGYNVVYNDYSPYHYLKSNVKSIVIDEGITSVGNFGFWQFGEVESVQLPSTVTYIGASAFQQCYSLKTIDIPEGVTYIGQQAFDGCDTMENVELPAVLETIGMYAFRDCKAFTEVTVPESVTSVGTYAFEGIDNLKTVNWNANTFIPGYAFHACPSLIEVNLNKASGHLGDYAFMDCTSLTSIELPEGITQIGSQAFGNDVSLTEVIIPDTVTVIESAFYGCTALESIELPDGVTELGNSAFYGCMNLSSLVLPSKITTVGAYTFYNCAKLENIVVPEGVTSIGDYAFYGCLALANIELPDTVKSIGDYAFLECNCLEEIHILNAACTLGTACLPEGITVYGYDGSAAHDYATLYEYPYVSLGLSDIGNFTVNLSTTSYLYNGTARTPEVTISGLTEGTDYTVSYSDNTNAGTALVTVTGMGNFTGTAEATFKINPTYLNSCVTVEFLDGTSYVYTGSEIHPRFAVTTSYDPEGLVEGEDYTLTYSNNINKGTATVVFTGINNYYSTSQRTFTITAKPISELNLSLAKTEYTYTGSVIYPEITNIEGVTYSTSLGENVVNVGAASCTIKASGNYTGSQTFEYTIVPKDLADYGYYLETKSYIYTGSEIKPYLSIANRGPSVSPTVTYSNNVNVGTGTITLTSEGNVVGTVVLEFEITPKSIKNYSMTISPLSCAYTGTEIKPTVSVSNLVEGTDFTVSYENNVEIGYSTAKAIVTGIGNYTGTMEKTFSILAKNIGDCDISLEQTEYDYTGSAIKPVVKAEGLTEGTDYTVSYSDCIEAGTGYVIIQGKGNYTGQVKKSFTIRPIAPDGVTASLDFAKATYTGNTITPGVTVKGAQGEALYEGTDFTLSYSSSSRKNVGRYYVKVTFTRNYTGSKKLYFMILPKAPASPKVSLYGYNDVKFSWKKATGASGYYVYFKKSGASSYTYLGATTKLYYKKANLADGKKFTFKVVPYYTYDGKNYKSLKSATASVYTLKKISTPTVTKSGSTKVKVKWTNINGETGYQISKATSKTKTNVVATYKTTTGTTKTLTVTKGTTYYYKVRAYKVVDGKKIYGPWSSVKKFKL